MVHLRATGQVRILVAVLVAKKTPKLADVCVGNSVYRLLFKPDEVMWNDAADPEDDDDDLLSDGGNGMDEGDRVMEDAEKPQPSEGINDGSSDKSPPAPKNIPAQKQAAMVGEGVDLACDQLINEISFKVMLERDDGLTMKKFSPLTKEELAGHNNLVDAHSLRQPSASHFVSSKSIPSVDTAAATDAQVLGEDDAQGCTEDASTLLQAWERGSTSLSAPPSDTAALQLSSDQLGGGSSSPTAPTLATDLLGSSPPRRDTSLAYTALTDGRGSTPPTTSPLVIAPPVGDSTQVAVSAAAPATLTGASVEAGGIVAGVNVAGWGD